MSFNSLKWDKASRKTNIYVMLGAGGNNFKVDYEGKYLRPDNPLEMGTRDREWASHIAAGAGIAFRLGDRVNLGIEHQAFSVFGFRADFLDGFNDNVAREPTSFRDILNFTSLTFNFNLGNPTKRAEPLYWINPMDVVLKDMSDLRETTAMALQDSDNDGVIDAIDQEPNTPADVPVDTKGRTLDSDRDGVPDYKDREPYYTPRPGENVNDQGVVTNPIAQQGAVTEDRVRELIDEALRDYQLQESGTAVAEWFLPMIHFGTDSYTVKYSDYGTLASVARMMKGNDRLRLVVTGFTDQTGPETYNEQLSYLRAKAVIDHMVNNHGIGRGRLVLQWRGQTDALVPSTSSYMNRRVEFRVATASDVEMDPPPMRDSRNRDRY